MSMPARSARDAWASPWSSATKPRSSTTPTGSSSTTTSRSETPLTPRNWPRRSNGSPAAPGHSPRAVTADRGYGEASVERDLHELGVRSVAIPRSKQTQRRAPRVRTPASLPREGQMAHRIRRTDQPHQTKLRLEPHRTHRHPRSPNLVRTRRLRPQPRQDRRPRSMKPIPSHNRPPRPRSSHRRSPPSLRRGVLKVEVARYQCVACHGAGVKGPQIVCPG